MFVSSQAAAASVVKSGDGPAALPSGHPASAEKLTPAVRVSVDGVEAVGPSASSVHSDPLHRSVNNHDRARSDCSDPDGSADCVSGSTGSDARVESKANDSAARSNPALNDDVFLLD